MTQDPLRERLFLRRNGVVLGPFTRQQLKALRDAGEVPADAEVSPDKRTWSRLTAPPAEDAQEPSPAREEPLTAEDAAGPPVSAALPADADREIRIAAAPEVAQEPVPPTCGELLAAALAMLWNSSDFLPRIRARGAKAALWSTFFALLCAFALTALALGLFASRYNVPPAKLARSVLLAPAVAFLFFAAGFFLMQCCRRNAPKALPELHLLTAAFGTFQLAFFLTLMLALAFLRNPALYRLPPWGERVLFPVMAAGAVFFVGQTLAGFRLNLMNNLGVAPGRATRIAVGLVWAALTAAGYMLVPCMNF